MLARRQRLLSFNLITWTICGVGLNAHVALGQNAQTGAITGTVVARSSGQPVAGAEVTVEGANLSAVTNSAGRFRIDGAPARPVTLMVRTPGYLEMRVPNVQTRVDDAGAPRRWVCGPGRRRRSPSPHRGTFARRSRRVTTFRFLEEAAREYEDAVVYHELQATGLGLRLVSAKRSGPRRAATPPRPFVWTTFRKCRAARSPDPSWWATTTRGRTSRRWSPTVASAPPSATRAADAGRQPEMGR